jgi:CMP-N,N'-diacetyllegionaminic acid synthase
LDVINGQTVLAVIPARSGSKRCPNKNFRDFRGKPLYMWSVEAASNSKYIDSIKLSMDEDRPAQLCTDTATCEDVIRFHLQQAPHDWVVLLQPTSPLRTTEDIDNCIERAQLGDACVSYRRDKTKNGAVYVAKREWIEKYDFSNIATMRYIMPDERSLDINFEEDFHV